MATSTYQFELQADFTPTGDQPEAISRLVDGVKRGEQHQTLLGVTGSGKTFTVANVIAALQRPTLVISHNKTLAAQLYSEFKHFFPNNAVEYFISYYDYYLPEAYIPQTDTYIAKDSSVNEEIEKLRLAASSSLVERRDVIVVASVSCIYGLGSPGDFAEMSIQLMRDAEIDRQQLLRRLVDLLYERNDVSPGRGQFQVAGDTVDIYLAYRDDYVRVEFWGDTIERITYRDTVTRRKTSESDSVRIFPARHFMLPEAKFRQAEGTILEEMKDQVRMFEASGRLVEAQRIFQRTQYDLEMMRELGYCNGVENYSRHLAGRPAGSRPYTLVDFFPDDFLTVIDESHATLPQLRAMYNADQSRKRTLVEHGFRLPSALDNRPLNFTEFTDVVGPTLYVTATPGPYELEHSLPVQQVLRPTGLLEPQVMVRPLATQVDDLIGEIQDHAARSERVLVTALTKRTSEALSDYLRDLNIRVKYIHSDIGALERVEILRDLRTGRFDCLVGVNLLREGLDLPEVALVAVLDADKEGFLRSVTALVQTAGRAARHVNGRVILYADTITDSMATMIQLTETRRQRQMEYNHAHGIIPHTVNRPVQESLRQYDDDETERDAASVAEVGEDYYDVGDAIEALEEEMRQAADKLEFERAAMLRDQIRELRANSDTSSLT